MKNKNINNRLTTEEATEKVEKICNLKGYEFICFCDENGNECTYKNNKTHLKLFCKKCGKIWTSSTYNRFTQGTNCPNCKKIDEKEAIVNIEKICENLNYTFLFFCDKNKEKTKWHGVFTHLALKCNNCGNIWYTCSYDNFIRGRKCPLCKHYFKKEKLDSLLKKCKKNKWEIIGFYDDNSEKTTWENCYKIRLKCCVCGYVWDRRISSIYNNSKCPKCSLMLSAEKRLSDKTECLKNILDVCKKRNYEFLGYCDKKGNDCEWYGSSTYLILKCLHCNQIWKTCTYYNFTHHLRGCPKCKQSHLENDIKQFLLSNKIVFEEQKRFDWLGYQSIDFFIPSKNIGIECQGRQHFEQGWWTDDTCKLQEDLEKIYYLDQKKKKLCEEHNISLIYFSNLGIKYPYDVIENKEILLKKITE